VVQEAVMSAVVALAGVFTLFPGFTLFFDGTKRQYCCKNRLVVNVQVLKPGFSVKYSTIVLFWHGGKRFLENVF